MSIPATHQRLFPPPRVARQPIWTREHELFAHELLYRGHDGRPAGVDRWHATSQDHATTTVLTALREGAPYLREGRAFVNVTRSFVVDDLPLPPPHANLVLEILESVPADDEVMAGLERLRDLGHTIALDDFAADEHQVEMLPFADFVKVDCRELVRSGSAIVDLARRDGATLVAERVSEPGLVERCLGLGFDLLQGDALGAATTRVP